MGNKSASAYNLGVSLGLASYQSSVKQTGLASAALAEGKSAANALVAAGFLTSPVFDSLYNPPDVSHSHLEGVRALVGTTIRDHSGDAANVYTVALLIALAEGQTTSPEWNKSFTGPNDLAHRGLEQAQTVIRSFLSSIPFDSSMMTYALDNTIFLTDKDTAHSAVSRMRLAYEDTVRFSTSLP